MDIDTVARLEVKMKKKGIIHRRRKGKVASEVT